MWIMLLPRDVRDRAYPMLPSLSMQAVVEVAELQHWNHNPLLDTKILSKGSSDLQGSWKIHTLWRSRWLFCGQFGSWTERTSLSQEYQREAILKGKRKLILGVAFLRQGHQFLDIPPIEKWGLCPLPMNLSGLVLLWPMEYGGRDVTWLPRLGHAMSWDSALLAGLLLESWALQRGKPCISALDDSPSWAHPSSHPSPGTSRLHEISRWFLSPAVLINLRWGPRYYRADTSHAPLSPIQIPAPQNLSVS